MSSMFKTGDYVKCVKSNVPNLTLGKVYRIKSSDVKGYLVHVINDMGHSDFFNEIRFSHIDDNAMNRLLYPEAFDE